MIDFASHRLLRRHIVHRSHDHAGAGFQTGREFAVGGSVRCARRSENFASPKSSTFTWPRDVIMMLGDLMSRCVMPFACAWSRASAI